MSENKEVILEPKSITDQIHYIKLPSYSEIISEIRFPNSKVTKIEKVQLYDGKFKLLSTKPDKNGVVNLLNYPLGILLYSAPVLMIYGELDKKNLISATYKFLDDKSREKLICSEIKYRDYKIVGGYLKKI